jgi:hypothetical protein
MNKSAERALACPKAGVLLLAPGFLLLAPYDVQRKIVDDFHSVLYAMLTYTTVNSASDLEGILTLQKANLAVGLSLEEIQSQGFVTVSHSLEQLKKMNDAERHIIAKDGDRVVGYLLAMTQQCRYDIPILLPMFNVFDSTPYKGKPIAAYRYLVVGQACIDKAYRGQGVFDKCYTAYKDHFNARYDFAITEIASTNLRSRNAHKRVGFEEISSYVDPDNTTWIVVTWDWN